MVKKITGEELGYFSVSANPPYNLNISINDTFQGYKLSYELLKIFHHIVTTRYDSDDECGNKMYKFENGTILRSSDILAIDVDASQNSRGKSFWDHIGMTPNRQCERLNTNCELRGYEKTITLNNLLTKIEQLPKIRI